MFKCLIHLQYLQDQYIFILINAGKKETACIESFVADSQLYYNIFYHLLLPRFLSSSIITMIINSSLLFLFCAS